MASPSSSLAGPKRVVDWNHHLIGYLDPESEPSVPGNTSLRVHLSPEARDELGTTKEDVALPFQMVASMRRDEVMLDRSSQALRDAGL